MGVRTVIFPWKIGKQEHPIDFLGLKKSVVLTELTFFSQSKGTTAEGFREKFEKKWHESTVFLRECAFFWQKMDVLVENRRIFDEILAWEQPPLKNQNKRASYWLFLALKIK